MIIAKFNIGDGVSTIPTGQVSCGAYKINLYNINSHKFKNNVIINKTFNKNEDEWWYQTSYNTNWYNESGLIRVYEEVKNYEIY